MGSRVTAVRLPSKPVKEALLPTYAEDRWAADRTSTTTADTVIGPKEADPCGMGPRRRTALARTRRRELLAEMHPLARPQPKNNCSRKSNFRHGKLLCGACGAGAEVAAAKAGAAGSEPVRARIDDKCCA